MPKPKHPATYELPYHDGVVALRHARRCFERAAAEAASQIDADAAFEWANVLKEISGHVDAAIARAEAAGDPVARHAFAADPGAPVKGTD